MYYTISYGLLYIVTFVLQHIDITLFQNSAIIIIILNYFIFINYINQLTLLLRSNIFNNMNNILYKILFSSINSIIIYMILYNYTYDWHKCIDNDCMNNNIIIDLVLLFIQSILLLHFFIHLFFPLYQCKRQYTDYINNESLSINNDNMESNIMPSVNIFNNRIKIINILFLSIISYNIFIPFVVKLNSIYILLYQTQLTLMIILMLKILFMKKIYSIQELMVVCMAIISYIIFIVYSIYLLFTYDKYIIVLVNFIILFCHLFCCFCSMCNNDNKCLDIDESESVMFF